jgi:hypothetical protein
MLAIATAPGTIHLALQLFLQAFRTIAIAASPRFHAIFMPAIGAEVRVLHHQKLEIFSQ